jgi:hypothetical protein
MAFGDRGGDQTAAGVTDENRRCFDQRRGGVGVALDRRRGVQLDRVDTDG